MTTTTGWRWRETAGAVAIAAVIAALGGAAIFAATEGSSHTFGPPHPAFGRGGGMPGGQHAGVGGPGPRPLGRRRCMASSWCPTATVATPRS